MKYNIFRDGKKTFSHTDASVGEFVYIIVENLILMILSILIGLGIPRNATVSYVFSFLIELGFVATVFIAARASKTAILPATGIDKKISLKQAAFVLLLSVIALYGFSPITSTFVDFLTNIGYESSSDLAVDTWGKYILFVFLMAIVPAICEEFLFRGLIYRGLTTWNKKAAIFISALLFMLMHGSPDQTIHQLLLGIVLALLFEATGSLWAPILLHFLNNFIALTMNFIYSQIPAQETAETVTKTPWGEWALYGLYALLMTAIAGYVIWWIIKILRKDKNNADAQKQQVAELGDSQNQSEQVQTEVVNEPVFVSDRNNKLAIILFSLAGVWLVVEWVMALVQGFM